MAPKRTTRLSPATTLTPLTTTTITSVTNAQLQAMIDQGVTIALAARDANRSTNGEDNHNSGTGVRRNERATCECTYPDFMKCQPLNFKGTQGVVKLTQWMEKMETVFRISHYSMENQIKFSTCTLLGNALTWWNSHVRTVGNKIAYAMTWTELKKKMTEKYCPRTEIKKLKVELWNLNVKRTDVISVVASKPKTMQNAVEIVIELMDKKIHTFAERQTESKRSFKDRGLKEHSITNHHKQKRQTLDRAYTARELYQAIIVCAEKILRIPLGNETLIVHGDGSNWGHEALAHYLETEDKWKEKRLEDVIIIQDFLDVFPEDFRFHRHVMTARVFAGYYRRFMRRIFEDAKPMTKLTQKKSSLSGGDKPKQAFQLLKQKLCSAPILALPKNERFIVYCDASIKGLGAVLMQREKVIAYASRQLKIHEEGTITTIFGTWSSSVRS
ncbi:reverse transcriptase domain-containing protein [Tanacetum coccineum]